MKETQMVQQFLSHQGNNMNIWDIVKPEFSQSENWGDPMTINRHLVMIIYCIRCDLMMPMVIHCGVEVRGSGFHPKKMAVDFHFVSDAPLTVQYEVLNDYLIRKGWDRIVGLGIYPDWNSPGFHLDIRGKLARWGRINKNEYVSIEQALEWGKERGIC